MTLRDDLKKKAAEARYTKANANVLAAFDQCAYLMGTAAGQGREECPLNLGSRVMTQQEIGTLVSLLENDNNNIDVTFDADGSGTLRWN
jgi:hypothetical protein